MIRFKLDDIFVPIEFSKEIENNDKKTEKKEINILITKKGC